VKPKSYKIFKKDIGAEVGVHDQVVDDFITFFYSKVRKNLSDSTYPNINVTGLGTFTVRKVRLEKSIKKNKSNLGNLEKNTINGYEKHLAIKDKINKMENILSISNDLIDAKKKFKNEKK